MYSFLINTMKLCSTL